MAAAGRSSAQSVCGLPYLIKAAQDDVQLARSVQVLEDRAEERIPHHLRHGVRRVEADVGRTGKVFRKVMRDMIRIVAERYLLVYRDCPLSGRLIQASCA